VCPGERRLVFSGLVPKVALQTELCGVEQEEMNRCVEP
jgi:hypothetical protein